MTPRHLGLLFFGVFVALSGALGCFSDFDAFTVTGSQDGGPTDGAIEDGGNPRPDNPIRLGRSCNDPHLALALKSSSGTGEGRLLHFNINSDSSLTECHENDLVRTQGAFGPGVTAVSSLESGREVIAVSQAVLGLDESGFPLWRWQLWDRDASDFENTDIFPLRIAGDRFIGLLHCSSYCSAGPTQMMILDEQGFEVHHVTKLPRVSITLAAAAPHPDGSNRVILAPTSGRLEVFTLDTSTSDMTGVAGASLGDGEEFQVRDLGVLKSLESDITTRRLVITYNNAIVLWEPGQPIPTAASALACQDVTSYLSATIDPDDARGAFAIATHAGSRHLIHMNPTSCTVVVDGTTYGGQLIGDVALVRGELRGP